MEGGGEGRRRMRGMRNGGGGRGREGGGVEERKRQKGRQGGHGGERRVKVEAEGSETEKEVKKKGSYIKVGMW